MSEGRFQEDLADCGPPSAVGVQTSSVLLSDLVIDGTAADCGPDGMQGDGLLVDFSGRANVTLSGSRIQNLPGAGASVQRDSLLTVRNNAFVNVRTGVRAGDSVGLAEGHGLIARSNTISGAQTAVQILGSTARVVDNLITTSGIGVFAGGTLSYQGFADIRRNILHRNTIGIRAEEYFNRGFGFGVQADIRSNDVRDSIEDGISVSGYNIGAVTVRGNVSLGSGRFDCIDDRDPPFATWVNNVGLTDQPDVCRPPR